MKSAKTTSIHKSNSGRVTKRERKFGKKPSFEYKDGE